MAEKTGDRRENPIETVHGDIESDRSPTPASKSSGSWTDSGRLPFQGVDMAFLTIDGHQMFTLYEILEKLYPGTPRTTVCTRMVRMNVLRHACTKEEIRKLRSLGGIRNMAINCTLIARKDVERFCQKYKDKTQNDASSSSGKSVALSSNDSASHLDKRDSNSTVFTFPSVATKPEETDNVRADGHRSEVSDSVQAVGESMEDVNKSRCETTTFETETNEASKQSDSSSSAVEHAFSDDQRVYTNSELSKPDRLCSTSAVISQSAGSPPGDNVVKKQESSPFCDGNLTRKHKRKRRTDFEMLQSCCDKIVDSFYDLPSRRQRKDCNTSKANIRGSKKKRNLTANKSNGKQSNPPPIQPEPDKAEVFFGEESGEQNKCYLDLNDNETDTPLEPRSPTLLLKRSVNNEWRIAKSSVPSFSLDIDESISLVTDESLPKAETKHDCKTTNLSHLRTSATAESKRSRSSSKPKLLELNNNVKNNRVGRRSSTKKTGQVKGRASKPSTLAKKKKEKQGSQMLNLQSNVPSLNLNNRKDSVKSTENQTCGDKVKVPKPNSGLENTVSNNRPKERDGALSKEGTALGLFKAEKGVNNINKANNGNGVAEKKRRRRRVQVNTFRLIETIPYQSFLMVKDGDLCPMDSLTYSSTKHVPGCCHPLWRWRLGKPVPIPKQPQVKTLSPGEQENKDFCENSDFIGLKNDEVSSKESTDSQA